MDKPIIYGHRGAAGYYPENTMISFEKAIEMGATGIELDVHVTKDGVVVVCHDESIDRTTDGKGFIKDMSYQQLLEYNAANLYKQLQPQKIPRLQEVIELAKDNNLILNIELKSGVICYPGIEQRVVELLESSDMTNQTIISSFNHYSLMEVKKNNPRTKIGLLYMAGLVEPWYYAKRIGAEALHPLFYNIVPQIVEGSKSNNIMLNPFTVNNPQHMEAMIKMGVDGIITDYPDRLKGLMESILD